MISSSSISSPHIFVSQIELVFILNSFISLDWLHLINHPPRAKRGRVIIRLVHVLKSLEVEPWTYWY